MYDAPVLFRSVPCRAVKRTIILDARYREVRKGCEETGLSLPRTLVTFATFDIISPGTRFRTGDFLDGTKNHRTACNQTNLLISFKVNKLQTRQKKNDETKDKRDKEGTRSSLNALSSEQQVFADIAYQCHDGEWGQLVGGTLRLPRVECGFAHMYRPFHSSRRIN
ncbi:hypothetical protein PUN28_012434 [Cardiocondyla obscurior]|uniref:Uncharacterized protein n=1 Tax=Cardiocondyla obscurior TaxID=286306 RepID=A0AAW2FE20_9HYME